MQFVVDAGVGTSVEHLLREMGYPTVAVRDVDPHLPDVEVLALAHQHKAIVITMDKDFGDLIFKERRPRAGHRATADSGAARRRTARPLRRFPE